MYFESLTRESLYNFTVVHAQVFLQSTTLVSFEDNGVNNDNDSHMSKVGIPNFVSGPR